MKIIKAGCAVITLERGNFISKNKEYKRNHIVPNFLIKYYRQGTSRYFYSTRDSLERIFTSGKSVDGLNQKLANKKSSSQKKFVVENIYITSQGDVSLEIDYGKFESKLSNALSNIDEIGSDNIGSEDLLSINRYIDVGLYRSYKYYNMYDYIYSEISYDNIKISKITEKIRAKGSVENKDDKFSKRDKVRYNAILKYISVEGFDIVTVGILLARLKINALSAGKHSLVKILDDTYINANIKNNDYIKSFDESHSLYFIQGGKNLILSDHQVFSVYKNKESKSNIFDSINWILFNGKADVEKFTFIVLSNKQIILRVETTAVINKKLDKNELSTILNSCGLFLSDQWIVSLTALNKNNINNYFKYKLMIKLSYVDFFSGDNVLEIKKSIHMINNS